MGRFSSVSGVSDIVANLRRVLPYLKEEQKKVLQYAAVPLVEAIKSKAPVGKRDHTRYNKGRKTVYTRGNLRNSIQILNLRRTPNVFVGPKVGSGRAKRYGTGKIVDAYYAHMVEFGTVHYRARPYMRPGFIQAAPHVIRRIELGIRQRMKQIAAKNGWKEG